MQHFLPNRIAALFAIAFLTTGSTAIQLGAGIGELPTCTLIADYAYSFDSVFIFGDAELYANDGVAGAATFGCDNVLGNPYCVGFLFDGGPSGNGSIFVDSFLSGSFQNVGLTTPDKSPMDYSVANELTVAFHFKTRGPLTYGLFRSPILSKTGEFFSGGDNSGNHTERICMNVDVLNDLGGPDVGGIDCGASVSGTNNGLSATTGVLSVPPELWQHIALVFAGENPDPDDGSNEGTYSVYIDGVLVNTETGIDGVIPNTVGAWTIGIAPDVAAKTDYEIDNLQIFNEALDQTDILSINCNVPD